MIELKSVSHANLAVLMCLTLHMLSSVSSDNFNAMSFFLYAYINQKVVDLDQNFA